MRTEEKAKEAYKNLREDNEPFILCTLVQDESGRTGNMVCVLGNNEHVLLMLSDAINKVADKMSIPVEAVIAVLSETVKIEHEEDEDVVGITS